MSTNVNLRIIMKRSFFVGLALATALAAAPAAKADMTVSFLLSGTAITDPNNPNCCSPNITASGFLTGVLDPNNPGFFDITGSSGVTFTFSWPDPLNPASPNVIGTYNASIYLVGEPTSPAYPYSLQSYYYANTFYFPFDGILTPGSVPVVDNNGLVFLLSDNNVGGLGGYEAAISIYAGAAENPLTPCTSSADCVYWWDEFWASPDVLGSPYYGVPNAINDSGFGDPLDALYVSPEPSSFLLFGTGMLGFAAFLYRRRQTEQHRAV
jgi:hypothetical protein